MLKKLFGGIDLTWKKLILFAVILGAYTGIMAILPWTANTSFRDIAINYECWILFGIIIITNSKSPMDSALKCFIFFLISQPLVYLVEVPFHPMGFELFKFYKFWFLLTLLTPLMGYIGYYIKKKNIWSLLILSPMFIMLSCFGIEYLSQAVNNFPNHLLSSVFCFAVIVIVTLGIFDKPKPRITSFLFIASFTATYLLFCTGIKLREASIDLSEQNISLNESSYLSSFEQSSSWSDVKLIRNENDKYELKISGTRNTRYHTRIKTKNSPDDSVTYCDIKCHFDMVGNLIVDDIQSN